MIGRRLSIHELARRHGVHRRTVRQALACRCRQRRKRPTRPTRSPSGSNDLSTSSGHATSRWRTRATPRLPRSSRRRSLGRPSRPALDELSACDVEGALHHIASPLSPRRWIIVRSPCGSDSATVAPSVAYEHTAARVSSGCSPASRAFVCTALWLRAEGVAIRTPRQHRQLDCNVRVAVNSVVSPRDHPLGTAKSCARWPIQREQAAGVSIRCKLTRFSPGRKGVGGRPEKSTRHDLPSGGSANFWPAEQELPVSRWTVEYDETSSNFPKARRAGERRVQPWRRETQKLRPGEHRVGGSRTRDRAPTLALSKRVANS